MKDEQIQTKKRVQIFNYPFHKPTGSLCTPFFYSSRTITVSNLIKYVFVHDPSYHIHLGCFDGIFILLIKANEQQRVKKISNNCCIIDDENKKKYMTHPFFPARFIFSSFFVHVNSTQLNSILIVREKSTSKKKNIFERHAAYDAKVLQSMIIFFNLA